MKLLDEIEKQKREASERFMVELTEKNNLSHVHAILSNLPDDCELVGVNISHITGYVFASIHVGNDYFLPLRYSIVAGTITIGDGGFLPREKLGLGHKFWQDEEVIRACRIWIEKRP